MKILHTADWHIGKKLNGRDLIDDQRFVLEQLMNQIEELKPDIIVVAGDLYDRSNPSKEALNMVNHYLYKMNKEMDLPVLMINRKSTRLNSSHVSISYAVFCLKKKK